MEVSDSEPPRGAHWVILVAREHAELYEHLCRAFFGDAKVQVALDRRGDESRNPGWVKEQLRKDGVVIIRVPEDPSGSGSEHPDRV
jgi:hypothetical protein